MIDPGHGGHDSGAVGPKGKKESDCVHAVSQRLVEFLEPYPITLRLSRDYNYLSPFGRAQMANIRGVDLFLSIHANAGGGWGFEAWTSPGQTQSDIAAERLLTHYQNQFPDWPMRKDLGDGDSDKEARFIVLTDTSMPAVLFELQFIDHISGEQLLFNPDIQTKMAKGLGYGVLDYFGIPFELPGLLNKLEKEPWEALDHVVEELQLNINSMRKIIDKKIL